MVIELNLNDGLHFTYTTITSCMFLNLKGFVRQKGCLNFPKLQESPYFGGDQVVSSNICQDNEVVYSKETEWDVTNPDPQYHYDAILAALKLAKDTLPKVGCEGRYEIQCPLIYNLGLQIRKFSVSMRSLAK